MASNIIGLPWGKGENYFKICHVNHPKIFQNPFKHLKICIYCQKVPYPLHIGIIPKVHSIRDEEGIPKIGNYLNQSNHEIHEQTLH